MSTDDHPGKTVVSLYHVVFAAGCHFVSGSVAICGQFW